MKRKTYHFYKEYCHYYLTIYQHLKYLFLLHAQAIPAHQSLFQALNNQQLQLSKVDRRDLFQSHEVCEFPFEI